MLNGNQTVVSFAMVLSSIPTLVREFDQRSKERPRFGNMKKISQSDFRCIVCSAAGLCRPCAEFRRLRQLLPCRQLIVILRCEIRFNEKKLSPFNSLIGTDRTLDAFDLFFDVWKSKKNEPSLLNRSSILSPQNSVFFAKTSCIFSCFVWFISSLLLSIICARN